MTDIQIMALITAIVCAAAFLACLWLVKKGAWGIGGLIGYMAYVATLFLAWWLWLYPCYFAH